MYWADTAVSYIMNSFVGRGGVIWSCWLGPNVKGVKKESEVYNHSKVIVFTEENPWMIRDYSEYSFNDTHFTDSSSERQIDNFATFHNAPGNLDLHSVNI